MAFMLVQCNVFVHQLIYPADTLVAHSKNGFAVLLSTIPLVLGSVPLGFFAGNFFVWLIPPVRRVLDQEAKPFPKTSFSFSQRGLLKMVIYITAPAVVIAVIGALLPW